MNKNNTITEEIWRIADIARFIKLTPTEVSRRIIVAKYFPLPLFLPGQKTTRGKRWVADEVKAWAKQSLRVNK